MRVARVLAVLAAATIGCSAIIGAKDIYFDGDAGPGNPDASSSGSSGSSSGSSGSSSGSSGTSSGSSGTDGGGDAGCTADLQTSAQNCGRCNHDCQGGMCAAGHCLPVELAKTLSNPAGITVDATNVYVTTSGDGRVFTVPIAGGASKDLATGQTKAQGVQVQGTTLYWSNGDFPYDGTTYKGGVWKCTLPACGTPVLVAVGDWAVNVQLANGKVYFSASNDSTVRVALPDAGSAVVADTNKPFGLGVDATYAYYTSSQPNLYRARLDDAGTEAVGPLNADYIGYVAVDATRFYWTYIETGTGIGRVYGSMKSDPTMRTEYGNATTNKSPVGITVDAANVYWTTDGTNTGGTTNADGQVWTCPIAGCAASGPVLIADKLAFSGPIVADATSVYWVEYGDNGTPDGKVRKVAKP